MPLPPLTEPTVAVAPKAPLVIGWREWAYLPSISRSPIRAKIDTGARTAALHALVIDIVEQDGEQRVEFVLDNRGHSPDAPTQFAKLLDYRSIRSSNGCEESRPIIETKLRIGSVERMIEVSLTDRDRMSYALLIGRAALGDGYLINPSASYLTGEAGIA